MKKMRDSEWYKSFSNTDFYVVGLPFRFGIFLAAIIKFRLSFGATFDLEKLDSSLMYANDRRTGPIPELEP